MWTEAARSQYTRKSTRYSTDVTDEEWAVIKEHFSLSNKYGRPRK